MNHSSVSPSAINKDWITPSYHLFRYQKLGGWWCEDRWWVEGCQVQMSWDYFLSPRVLRISRCSNTPTVITRNIVALSFQTSVSLMRLSFKGDYLLNISFFKAKIYFQNSVFRGSNPFIIYFNDANNHKEILILKNSISSDGNLSQMKKESGIFS